MRVLFAVTGGHYGSYHTSTEYIVGARARGFEPVIVTPEENAVSTFAREHNVPVTIYKFFGRTFHLQKGVGLANVARRHRVDLIHTFLAFPYSMLVRLAGFLAGVPVLEHAGTAIAWHPDALIARYHRVARSLTARLPGVIVCMSEAIRRQFLEGGLAPESTVMIHHGVDVEAIAETATAPIASSLAALLARRRPIACVGHLSTVKGQRDVIIALSKIMADYPDAHLLLIGAAHLTHYDPTYGTALMELASNLGVQDHVTFAGHLERLQCWALLHRCFALAHVPLREGFGAVVPEAMAAGIPVVASAVDALPEIVRDGIDGLLVPPSSPNALAEALRFLLADRSRAVAMGAKGQERVRKAFSLVESQNRVFRLYGPLCAKRPVVDGISSPP